MEGKPDWLSGFPVQIYCNRSDAGMCKVSTFITGVCVGMVAGALVEVMVIPRPKTRKTAVGKAMQRMGNAVDSALETVAEKMN